MEHADQQVDIVNQNGLPVGTKLRRDVDKRHDLCHNIFVLVTAPDKRIILSEIPARNDLPNLYSGLLGATVATIRRHDENKLQAAERACAAEIYVNQPELTEHAEWYQRFADGTQKYITVYQLAGLALEEHSPQDIAHLKYMTPSEVNEAMQTGPERFAPTFQSVWARCQSALFA